MGSEDLNLTKLEVAQIVQSQLGCDIFESADKDRDVRHFFVRYGKIQNMGWSCKFDVKDGVNELVKAYRMVLPRSPAL
jgi:nucleoside-diphosphate-sugar epimerase